MFNKMDFSYGMGFFRVRPGMLAGIGDIAGFMGSEAETMSWIDTQFKKEAQLMKTMPFGIGTDVFNTNDRKDDVEYQSER